MISHTMVDELLALPDSAAQEEALRAYVEEAEAADVDSLAEALKDRVLQKQQANVQETLDTVALLKLLAVASGEDQHQALALRMEAQTQLIGLANYQESLVTFDKALELYRLTGDKVGEATTEVTRIWALAALGQYEKALDRAAWADQVLSKSGNLPLVARLRGNRAIILGRLARDSEALEMLDASREALLQAGNDDPAGLINNAMNRGIILRNLGRFDEAIDASLTASEMARNLGWLASEARVRQNLGIIYFILGRYNEALKSLDDSRHIFLEDGRQRDAVLVDLFISDCLLQLRRYPEVLEKSAQVRELFAARGTRFEVGQSWLNEAVARIELGQQGEAAAALASAQKLFTAEGNEVWSALVDLQQSNLFLRMGCSEEAYTMAKAAAAKLEAHQVPVAASQGRLLAAQAATEAGYQDEAWQMARAALDYGISSSVPLITFRAHQMLGRQAAAEQNFDRALQEYDRAIGELERMQGRIITEYRATFVEDKLSPYEDAALICLKNDEPKRGLSYVERAKARALLNLISQRIDLSVEARAPEDQPIVNRLMVLARDRDRLVRRGAIGAETAARDVADNVADQQVSAEVLAIEKKMTDLWHRLLIRNAGYARDASLWQVRTEQVTPYLDTDTVLLEYFSVGGAPYVIAVTQEGISWWHLASDFGPLEQLLRLLSLNLRTVPHATPVRAAALVKQAQSILKRLYDVTLAPLREAIKPFRRLIIVPHGPLHYLPFHALFDGENHLVQTHEVSYLPGASFLRYVHEHEPVGDGALVAANSWDGRLVHTKTEARMVGQLWDSAPLLEDEVTLDRIRRDAPNARLLHLAMHGDFRPDNPLFSGLLLSDGWLTTLDIFGLRLNASLTTLSACQTGRSVIGGGEELFGLMRAFLTAGTASLLMTLWPVDDQLSGEWMETFYTQLAAGEDKGTAVRQAQLGFIESENVLHRHPYYWAPFFLVGARDKL